MEEPSSIRMTMTTFDGITYDLSSSVESVGVSAKKAAEEIEKFAVMMRTTPPDDVPDGTLWVEVDDEYPQLFFAFDPAVSDGWVDTIRPLPDIG